MNCALSGEVPSDPVVSVKSGHLFSRRLILKHLASTPSCPITGQPLQPDDLLPVVAANAGGISGGGPVVPRDVTATSVPALMSLLQKEWDANVLETFTLKKTVQELRQELSQALYQHDAACRVIARLIKERDTARAALSSLVGGNGASNGGASSPATEGGVPGPILAAIRAKAEQLKPHRKKRAKPATLAKPEELGGLSSVSTHTPHSASQPGVTCVAIHPVQQQCVATGGLDRKVKVFDRVQGKSLGTATGHTKTVTSVAWHPEHNVLYSSSRDASVRAWGNENGKYVEKVRFACNAPVADLAVQATGNYLASGAADGVWRLHDVTSGTTVTETKDTATPSLHSLAFHPDGLLLATGGHDTVAIWDLNRASASLRVFPKLNTVSSIAFSENGYHMASGSADGALRLWDLRKLACIKTLNVGSPVRDVSFDQYGTYLACASNDVRVLHVKQWSAKATITDFEGAVNGVALTNDARALATVGDDRTLRFYGI